MARVIGFIGHPDAGVSSLVREVQDLAPAPSTGGFIPPDEPGWTMEFIAGELCWIGPVTKIPGKRRRPV